MSVALSRTIYAELRDAILAFVANHQAIEMIPFKTNMASVDHTWTDGTVAHLRAAEFIGPALHQASPSTRALATLLDDYRSALRWEQSYTTSDGVVGSDMLDGYGFAEVIGKNGPFTSTKLRSGIGVWGPNIDYPVHRHEAEEIYVPLAGQAEFTLDCSPYKTYAPDSVIHVPSNTRHGFRTSSHPFVVFYIWQAGDLRQKSTFS